MNESRPDLFLKYDYRETKDLGKQFLSLVSAILVFSLTFSEKIIDFREASTASKALLMIAWTTMLGSIISCGIGLLLLSMAAGRALYLQRQYQQLAVKSYRFIVAAGTLLVLGLVALIATAFLSINSPPPLPAPATTPPSHSRSH